ncbi:MAG TPA: hypothetical protein DF383_11615, partial [Deltaproteobacteria bacterium]|nr:hypothetical protein [Deltaproteobacteria bacterium]
MSQPFKSYPYRPQRYHAWDVFETSPRVIFSDPQGQEQTFPLLNFSEQGLCLESPQPILHLKSGDFLRSIQVLFSDKVMFRGDAKVKHATFHKASEKWLYGLRLIEGKLPISEIFQLREQMQDRALVVERLTRIQRAPRRERDFLDSFDIQASFTWQDRKVPVQIENVSEFGFGFSLDAMADVELFAGGILQPDVVLEEFVFSVDGKCLFQGRVRVIHACKEKFLFKVGAFCLDGLSVSFSDFEAAAKLREAKKGLVLFLEKAEQSEKIHPEFKIALNDFRYFLESMKDYLDRSQKQIDTLPEKEKQEFAIQALMSFSENLLVKHMRDLMRKL